MRKASKTSNTTTTSTKKAPAKAPDKKSAERRKVATAPRFVDTAKIKLLETKNPKREGSKAAKLYKIYKTGKTVRQVLEEGQTRSNLRYDVAHGYITIK
jgi:hypothetical protein